MLRICVKCSTDVLTSDFAALLEDSSGIANSDRPLTTALQSCCAVVGGCAIYLPISVLLTFHASSVVLRCCGRLCHLPAYTCTVNVPRVQRCVALLWEALTSTCLYL